MITRGKSSGKTVVDEQKKGKSNASVIGSKAKLIKKKYEDEFVDIENRTSGSEYSPPRKLHRPSQETDSLSQFQTTCSTRHIYRHSNTLKEEKTFTSLTKMNFDGSSHWHKRHFSEETLPKSSSRPRTLNVSRDHNFSLTSHLDDDEIEEMTCSERLLNALKDGNLLTIGRIIRNRISSGTLSEVCLMEISKQTEPPKVPLMMNLLANENADLEDMKSYNAVSIFLQNFPSCHEKPLKRLQNLSTH
ncbi:Protein CBG21989 [Caenorhabditis briggsae]|uniref:Protein CBG21989 n=2 Tax=Caenorhabditis briggsae TaxID=6238 RepID=A8Y1A3_CAEBR|nr:Protein CBG21989 [Caenorhabditis briggsae]ULT87700.1 hypothetical protein L3Y34_007102 [Caenorhabditis briggsae]CAP38672.2 Protein CBG21989 [Caenorhabditis briggsae]